MKHAVLALITGYFDPAQLEAVETWPVQAEVWPKGGRGDAGRRGGAETYRGSVHQVWGCYHWEDQSVAVGRCQKPTQSAPPPIGRSIIRHYCLRDWTAPQYEVIRVQGSPHSASAPTSQFSIFVVVCNRRSLTYWIDVLNWRNWRYRSRRCGSRRPVPSSKSKQPTRRSSVTSASSTKRFARLRSPSTGQPPWPSWRSW